MNLKKIYRKFIFITDILFYFIISYEMLAEWYNRVMSSMPSMPWLLLGFFSGLGVLSHYSFLYLLIALGLFFIYMIYNKEFNPKCLISLITFLIVLLPHLIWLTENNFISIESDCSETCNSGIFNHYLLIKISMSQVQKSAK